MIMDIKIVTTYILNTNSDNSLVVHHIFGQKTNVITPGNSFSWYCLWLGVIWARGYLRKAREP